MKVILAESHNLKQELGSIIQEYAIVNPDHEASNDAGELMLGLRNQFNHILNPYNHEQDWS